MGSLQQDHQPHGSALRLDRHHAQVEAVASDDLHLVL